VSDPIAGTRIVTISENQTAAAQDLGVHFARIIDDGDSDFSTTGSWSAVTDSSAYGSDALAKTTGDGSAKATWRFQNLEDGYYEAFATWVADSSHSADAPFAAYDGTTLLATVAVDQQSGPIGLSQGGSIWESLGVFYVANGEMKIELSDGGSGGLVVADAVFAGIAGLDGRALGDASATLERIGIHVRAIAVASHLIALTRRRGALALDALLAFVTDVGAAAAVGEI
jgi:hypothetical protein